MARVLANYDKVSDVLYLSVGEPDRSARSTEDDEGLIWRSIDGKCVGVTIPDFEHCWRGRETDLAQLLFAHLPQKAVAQALAVAN
jgi:uncharacterized protein YuzE